MALVLKDRVKETTTTTGTGTITLAGAVTGFQSFSAIGNANTTYYTIAGQTGSEWEVGIGTYTSVGTTLARTTVLSSSNGGSAVNFSAGTKDVFVTYPSSRSVYADGTTLTATNSSVLPTTSGGTNLASFTANGIVYASSTSVLATNTALVFTGTNLGIGVSPTYTLDLSSATSGIISRFKSTGVYGTVAADNTGTTGGGSFSVRQNGTQYGIFGVEGAIQGNTSTDVAIFADNGSSLKFFTNGTGTLKANINTSGAWSFGSTGTNTGTSGQLLSSQGSGTNPTWVAQSSITVTPAQVSDQSNTSTGYLDLPAGTTAERPGSPGTGMIRYNSTTGVLETYVGGLWQYLLTSAYNYTATYVVVAGGGGGGNGLGSSTYASAGGGAGGYRSSISAESSGGGATAESALTLYQGTTYTITVGGGGAVASNGTNSVFSTITSTGGGSGSPAASGQTRNGGSGGGSGDPVGTGGQAAGTGTTGQGFGGGTTTGGQGTAGGGGGASAAGSNNTGGNGVASSVTGSSVTRAGGGSGGTGGTIAGGTGGGGSGDIYNSATAGGTNTGGGGGGTQGTSVGTQAGKAGGSGVVILKIATADYTGTTTGSPTVSTVGANTILVYNSSGTYTA